MIFVFNLFLWFRFSSWKKTKEFDTILLRFYDELEVDYSSRPDTSFKLSVICAFCIFVVVEIVQGIISTKYVDFIISYNDHFALLIFFSVHLWLPPFTIIHKLIFYSEMLLKDKITFKHITTNVVSSNPTQARCIRYNIMR